jgi:serine palmitoyltransferase
MGIAEPCLQSKVLNLSDPPAVLLMPDLSKEQQHPGPAPATSLFIWMDFPTSLRDGSERRTRLRRLTFNARYLHKGLSKLGFITYGDPSTPIIPLLIFNLTKVAIFHRMMKDRTTPIAVVIVAYLATSRETCRAHFCVSAAHTKEEVDLVQKACDEIGDILDLKHGRGDRWPIEDIMRSVELVNQ